MVCYDSPAKLIQVAKTAETTENKLCASEDVIHMQVLSCGGARMPIFKIPACLHSTVICKVLVELCVLAP